MTRHDCTACPCSKTADHCVDNCPRAERRARAADAGNAFGYRILGPATALLALGAIAFGLAALFTGGLG